MPPEPGSPPDLNVPARVAEAAALTDYAVTVRYPGAYEEVGEDEYHDALQTAEFVMSWTVEMLDKK